MSKHSLFISSVLVVLLASGFSATAGEPSQEKPVAFTANDKALEWGPCPELFPTGCEIAVLHGNPSEKNADVFFKVPGGYEIPNHWHTSPERMVLVSGKMSVKYEGHDAVELKKGEYAYGPAKLPHTASCRKGDDCVLMIAFEEAVDVHAAE